MDKLKELLIACNIIDEKRLAEVEINVNNRDLNIADLINIYKIRSLSSDNKNLKNLFNSLNEYSLNSNLKVRIVKLRGAVNKNLFVDSNYNKIIASLNIDI
jgi:hypothetical protein